MIRITKFRCNGFEEQSYLVWTDGACVVIDPGFDSAEEFDALDKVLKDNDIKPAAVLLTHAHPDHVYGVGRICGKYGIPVYVGRGEELTLKVLHRMCADIGHADPEDFSDRIVWVEDNGLIRVFGNSGLEFKALSTPGHTAGGTCYLCREFRPESGSGSGNSVTLTPGTLSPVGAAGGEEEGWKVLFSGDTLFAGCIGRSDLPGGDYDSLMKGIFSRILCLDGGIDVLPGHGSATTIADERMKNPFLQPFNEPYEEN